MAKDIAGSGAAPESASGKVAIVTATLTAANQNQWIEHMKTRLAKYPKLELVAVKPSNEDQKLAFSVTQDLMKAYPDLKGVFGISSVAFPGAAEAVKQAGKSGQVFVTGLSTPNDMKAYVEDGTVKSVILWNTQDLGYLTVRPPAPSPTAHSSLARPHSKPANWAQKRSLATIFCSATSSSFTKENIGNYDF
jgi:ABC-type sugar transport system substrate-binding protein